MRRLIAGRISETERAALYDVTFWVEDRVYHRKVYIPKKGVESEGTGYIEVHKWAAKIVAENVRDGKVIQGGAVRSLEKDLSAIRWQPEPNEKPPF